MSAGKSAIHSKDPDMNPYTFRVRTSRTNWLGTRKTNYEFYYTDTCFRVLEDVEPEFAQQMIDLMNCAYQMGVADTLARQ